MIYTSFSNIINLKTERLFFNFLICCLILLPSCASNGIKEPSIGVTYKFYTRKPQEIKIDTKYDFSRLENGYGLLIFSYILDGFKSIDRNERTIKKGVRIWEYKFSDQDEEIKIISDNITLFNKNKQIQIPLILQLLPIEKDKNKEIGVKLAFQRNKIIYGGRISASDYENNYIILERFKEDCTQFLNTYSADLEKIEINTILIKASKPGPKDKKIYHTKSYYDR